MLDVQNIRRDFPILESTVHGRPLVYLDNAATTQKPRAVIDKITDGYLHHNANVHRGVHFLSQDATALHEAARHRVQQFIGAESSDEIVFTRGTTESINLVAATLGDSMTDGDEIILTTMEHHSNIVPWQLLRRRKDIRLRVVRLNDRQELDLEHYRSLFTERTRLVTVAHVSNVLGTVNPVAEMIAYAHSRGVPVLVDAAQSVPHMRVDVRALDADFLVFSGHKVYGPTGIGVLYGKRRWLEQMPPYQGGGEMIEKVTFGHTTFNQIPYKFEAGTPDFIGTVALAAALDYVDALGLDAIEAYEARLLAYATAQFHEIEGMRIFGNARHKGAVLSFLVDGVHPYDMGLLLDQLGIAVRTGHHCADPLMQALGIEGTVRASFSFYNTEAEVDALVAGVRRVVGMLR